MTLDPCFLYVDSNQIFPSMAECAKYYNGVLKDGLSVSLTNYFETLRYLLTLYQDIEIGNDIYQNLDETVSGSF